MAMHNRDPAIGMSESGVLCALSGYKTGICQNPVQDMARHGKFLCQVHSIFEGKYPQAAFSFLTAAKRRGENGATGLPRLTQAPERLNMEAGSRLAQ